MAEERRRRLLFLMDCLYSDAGGGTEKQFLQLYRRHQELGVEPFVAFLEDAPVYRNIDWVHPPLVLDVRSLRRRAAISAFWRLRRFVLENDIEIVQTFYDSSALFGALLKIMRPSLKVLMSLRNMGYHHGPLLRMAMSLVFRTSDGIIVNAAAIARHLENCYWLPKGRVGVIYNIYDNQKLVDPLSDAEFDAIRGRHEKLAIVVSNLRDVKGIRDVLAAAKLLRDRIDLGWVVLGEGVQRSEYEALIAGDGLERCVYLLGYKPQVSAYLEKADVAVLASWSEGLSNALIEYTFAGKPIVATDVGGNAEILNDGQGGMLVPPRNPARLADCVSALLADQALAANLAAAARRDAKRRFDPGAIVDLYRHAYYGRFPAWHSQGQF